MFAGALITHTLAAGQLIQIMDMHRDHGSGRAGPALCGDNSTGYAKPGHVHACTKTLPCMCPQLRTARDCLGALMGQRCARQACAWWASAWHAEASPRPAAYSIESKLTRTAKGITHHISAGKEYGSPLMRSGDM